MKIKDLPEKAKTLIRKLFAWIKMLFGKIRDKSRAVSRKKKITVIVSSIVSVVLVISIVAGLLANHYLNKLNYGDVQGVVDENLDEEEEIDFDVAEFSEITEAEENSTKKSDEKKTDDKKTENSIIKILTEKEDYNNLQVSKEVQKKANEDIEKNIKSDDVWHSDDVYNVLVVGYDAGDDEAVMFEGATLPRSDAIMLVSVNKVRKTVKLVSLSRATYVAIPGHGNKRINTAHAYGGARMLVDTVELNYKIKIDHYISCDFNGFKAIVDCLGGVTIDMTQTEADFAFDDDTLPADKYTMNGKQALRYVRLRKTDSDRQRTSRQRKVMKEIYFQAKKMSTAQKLDFMNDVFPYVTTDFDKSELVSKLGEFNEFMDYPVTQDIIPHKATQLKMRDGKEVIILDWEETTDYVHSLMYKDVKVEKLPSVDA